MDPETIKTIGTGAGSGFVGVILAFLGFKSRLNSIERKLEHVVDDDTCKAVKEGVQLRIGDLKDNMDTRFDTLEGLILGKKK